MAAAREVGVSRTTGNNWSRGYKTYRNGHVIGFVPALDRLAVRQISPRFLSQDERIEIADLRHARSESVKSTETVAGSARSHPRAILRAESEPLVGSIDGQFRHPHVAATPGAVDGDHLGR